MNSRVFLLASLLLSAGVRVSSAQPAWCWESDYFTTSVAENVITITHHNAVYNCCPDHFEFTITPQGTRITVVETQVMGQNYCLCLCCYDLSVDIGPLLPDQYQILYHWSDWEHGESTAVLTVVVPGEEPTGPYLPTVVDLLPPPCQESAPSGVPAEPEADQRTVGAPRFFLALRPNPAPGPVTIECASVAGGRALLEMFDAGGRRIRLLLGIGTDAGRREVIWDRRDDAGAMVPPGVYFCRLRGDGGVLKRTVVLLP